MTDCQSRNRGTVCGLDAGHDGDHVSVAGTMRWAQEAKAEQEVVAAGAGVQALRMYQQMLNGPSQGGIAGGAPPKPALQKMAQQHPTGKSACDLIGHNWTAGVDVACAPVVICKRCGAMEDGKKHDGEKMKFPIKAKSYADMVKESLGFPPLD